MVGPTPKEWVGTVASFWDGKSSRLPECDTLSVLDPSPRTSSGYPFPKGKREECPCVRAVMVWDRDRKLVKKTEYCRRSESVGIHTTDVWSFHTTGEGV